MTTFISFAFALAFSFIALALNAQAQSSPIEVSTDDERVEFSAQGQTRSVYVEVFSPSGELVFETSGTVGQSINWPMVDNRGQRVPDGVYLATITVTDLSGKRRKRIEQITVTSPQYGVAAAQTASAPQTGESTNATGAGIAGRIAKWVDNAGTLGNSVISESVNKVGINVAPGSPTATLHVNNATQPAASANAGIAATALLQTSGGKGGNTTGTTGQLAGTGASISLAGGQGGNAPGGGRDGRGGSIILQPG